MVLYGKNVIAKFLIILAFVVIFGAIFAHLVIKNKNEIHPPSTGLSRAAHNFNARMAMKIGHKLGFDDCTAWTLCECYCSEQLAETRRHDLDRRKSDETYFLQYYLDAADRGAQIADEIKHQNKYKGDQLKKCSTSCKKEYGVKCSYKFLPPLLTIAHYSLITAFDLTLEVLGMVINVK